jgi:hypothetical protein
MAGNATTMTYGAYSFDPIPLMSITQEYERDEASNITNVIYRATLQGTLLPGVTLGQDGIANIDLQQDELMLAFLPSGLSGVLSSGVAATGCDENYGQGADHRFHVKCNGTTLIEANPRVLSISFDAGTWVDRSDYTVELEWDISNGSGTCPTRDTSESWDIEPTDSSFYDLNLSLGTAGGSGSFRDVNNPSFTVRHTVSAQGKKTPEQQAWISARDWCQARLGFDHEKFKNDGVLCLSATGLLLSNHSRTVSIDEVEGSYSVTETWTVHASGSGVWNNMSDNLGCRDDWSVDVQKGIDSNVSTVTIRGNIQGVEDVHFCEFTLSSGLDTFQDGTDEDNGWYRVARSKIDTATEHLSNIEGTAGDIGSSLIWARARYFSDGVTARPLNPASMTKQVGYNPAQGTISYSFSFNDKFKSPVTGVTNESIAITDSHPVDRIAEINVIGRPIGPILQNMGTITSKKRTVAYDAIVATTGLLHTPGAKAEDASGWAHLAQTPSANVSLLLDTYKPGYGDGTSGDFLIYKTEDTENFDPYTGKYGRRVSWIYTRCD